MSWAGSIIEEHSLILTLQDDVPFERAFVGADLFCYQCAAPLRGNEIQYRILQITLLVGEIHARD